MSAVSPDPLADQPLDAPARFERRAGDPPTLEVWGEVDVATSPTLRDELYALVDEGAPVIVVDLQRLEFIDSSGLGVLVGALKRVRERGGDLELLGLAQPALKVFEITGLTRLFTLRDA